VENQVEIGVAKLRPWQSLSLPKGASPPMSVDLCHNETLISGKVCGSDRDELESVRAN